MQTEVCPMRVGQGDGDCWRNYGLNSETGRKAKSSVVAVLRRLTFFNKSGELNNII